MSASRARRPPDQYSAPDRPQGADSVVERAAPPGPASGGRPRVVVVGLGPSGPELVPAATLSAVAGAARFFVRTERHPSVEAVRSSAPVAVEGFDHHYESGESFEEVYTAIVDDLVAAAEVVAPGGGYVAYAVPGSPFVAERTVQLLRSDGRVEVEVVHAPSFLDLVWDRLGVDPLTAGVRLVDGASFAVEAAGERGPLLVAQCHDRSVLSAMKLAIDDVDAVGSGSGQAPRAVLLHHLGLADEVVLDVAWEDLDRSLEPDHLTSVWIPSLVLPVASEMVRLDELVRTLRERCPWDRGQTHASLARHLLEESYETLDAIEELDAAEPEVPPGSSPISRKSSVICWSKCCSTPPWPPRWDGSRWLTWPVRSTTSWSGATRTSSVTRWPTVPKRWRPAGKS
ncbi:MAG TPA: SAM-dependent methyltransferase [Acidimicrobiales bacterium]|nr:SAM-dependent methyltransferase [Acidimicrobiales bacterium]